MARNKRSNHKDVLLNKKRILILADGITEINYIKGFIEFLKWNGNDIKSKYDICYKPNLGNTFQVYQYIKSTEYKYEYIFAFSDKDNANNKHDVYNNFCQMNRYISKVTSGYSNPCFEIWLLLHNKYRNSEISTRDLVRIFKQNIGVDYKSDLNIFELFKDKLEQSIDNSVKLQTYWEQSTESFANKNPSTNIHNIIKKLKILK